jgi:hypothetical protein
VRAAPDRWIGWTTTGCVALLALIAGTISYLHMHLLVQMLDANRSGPRHHPSRPGPPSEAPGGRGGASRDLRRQAWQWALAHRAGDGSLPSGREIARQYGRHERWGRLVKRSGAAGELTHGSELGGRGEPDLRLVGQRLPPAMDV